MNSDGPPIFIVGCPRSGTSLMRNILAAHSNIAFGPETHFLFEFEKIVGVHWDRIERYGFEKEYWFCKIADFFDSFKSEYAHKNGKKRWGEKTPSYAYQHDLINKLFPTCQIVHIVRNGTDVISSHRDRWGYQSVPKAMKVWKNSIKKVQEFSKFLPKDRYYEIRYEQIVESPKETLKPLFNYLNEPWEENVLDAESVKFADSASKYYSIIQKESSNGNSIYGSRVGAGLKNLDPFTKAFFRSYAGGLMKQLGYS